MTSGCKQCRKCTRRYACETGHGEIEWDKRPEIAGVYYVCEKELMRNTGAAQGSNIIVLHFRGRKEE